MADNFDVSADTLQLVEHLQLWGRYNIPVYIFNSCSTVEQYLNLKEDTTFNLKRGTSETLAITLINTYYQYLFSKAKSIAEEYYGKPSQAATVVETIENYYGKENQYIIKEQYTAQVISNTHSFGSSNLVVSIDSIPNNLWNVIQYTERPDSFDRSNERKINMINGVPGIFLKLQGNDGWYYGRCLLYLDAAPPQYSNNMGKIVIPASSYCDRMKTFFGGVGYNPMPLSSIIGATVVDPNTPSNPYEPGGDSGEGGGNGTFDDESDPIDIPSLPTLSSANTGFTRIYNPTLSQVRDLANYLWTDESVINTIWNHIKQFFENPMDAIIGFNLVPVPVPDGGTESFKLMYIDTGVFMTVAANQFVDVDCGTLTLEPYYGSALDYSPYTKISCFLPYIGNVSLNVDEVMNRTLHVQYRVDICSGSCVAYISVDGTVLYQYSGHCAIPVPLSSADFSSYVNSAISVGKLAGAALVGGAGAAMGSAAQDAAQQTNQVVTTTQTTTVRRDPTTRAVTGIMETSRVQTRESPADQSSTQASFAGLTPQNVANTVGQIMSSKPYIEHSGSFSGNSGYLGVRRPYLVIERPNMCMPANFQQFNGFPCMINLELGSCQGFTRVQQVQLTGVPATNPEQAEIMELLKSGVIF